MPFETADEAAVHAVARVLLTLFGGQHPADAAAHADTRGLIQTLIQEIRTMSDTQKAALAEIKAEVGTLTAAVGDLNTRVSTRDDVLASNKTALDAALAANAGLTAKLAAMPVDTGEIEAGLADVSASLKAQIAAIAAIEPAPPVVVVPAPSTGATSTASASAGATDPAAAAPAAGAPAAAAPASTTTDAPAPAAVELAPQPDASTAPAPAAAAQLQQDAQVSITA